MCCSRAAKYVTGGHIDKHDDHVRFFHFLAGVKMAGFVSAGCTDSLFSLGICLSQRGALF